MQTVKEAKGTAVSTYQTTADNFRNLDVDGRYFPQNTSIEDTVADMESALADVGAANQGEKVALTRVAKYLDGAARGVQRGQPAVAAIATAITGLAESPPGTQGSADALSALRNAESTLANMELIFRDLQSGLEGITPDETVIPQSEVETMQTAHSEVRTQIAELRALRPGVVEYVQGIDAFQAGRKHKEAGQATADNGNDDEATETFEAARTDFKTAETRLRGTKSTLEPVNPGVDDAMAANLSRLKCRTGAVADGRENLAQEMTARIEGDDLQIDKKQGDAEFALQRFASTDSS